MTDWPIYVSHKIVTATPIVRIDKADGVIKLYVDPSDGREPLELFEPSEPAMAARCQVTDYAVTYQGDGYRSICPRRQFLDGYSRKQEA